MNLPLIRKARRPLWMTPYGEEGPGDVWSDRVLWEWPRMKGEEWVPAFNFYEKEGSYFLEAEIPGVNKDDISVTIDKNLITISGRKEAKREEKGSNYYLLEASSGSFSRSIRVPEEIEEDKVKAEYKDGVLHLTLPSKKVPEAKKIKIET